MVSNRNLPFQGVIFRCKILVSGRVKPYNYYMGIKVLILRPFSTSQKTRQFGQFVLLKSKLKWVHVHFGLRSCLLI